MSRKVGGTSGIGDDAADLTGPWTERDGLLRSPLLEGLGLVAGFTTRRLGSMAGAVTPRQEQARNRQDLVGLGTGLAVIGRPA